MNLDYGQCARDGAIGGVGAIPGTLCAHPCDVVKMRQQIAGERLKSAVRGFYKCNGSAAAASKVSRAHHVPSPSIANFFAGVVPAVQQKVATRSTMFLASSASVQLFECHLHFSPTSAAFVGSFTSGYITGSLAAPWEWQKVLVSQRVKSRAAGKGLLALLSEAKKRHGGLGGALCIAKRMHAAGVRNAIFDSTFFGTKQLLDDWSKQRSDGTRYTSTGFCYGLAAIAAVTVDYAVDVSVKRLYAHGPESAVPSLGVRPHTFHIVQREGLKIYRGLGVKSFEFGISYWITGWMAPHVARVIDSAFATETAMR